MGVSVISNTPVYQAAQQMNPVAETPVIEKATDAVPTDTVTEKEKIPSVSPKDSAAQPKGEKSSAEEQYEASQERIRKAVDTINKQLSYTECQYGFHEKTNRVMLKIVDKETDKVIKELPPEKTLEMIAKAWELAGILVDEKL